MFAALAFELKLHGAAANFGMAVLQSGEAVGLILFFVFFIADANQAGFENLDERGEDLFAGEVFPGEITFHSGPDFWKRFGELEHAVVFGFVTHFAPAGMIAVLLAAFGVAAGGLKVAILEGANPNVSPCGRDCEALDAGEGIFVADGFSIGGGIGEIFAVRDALNAGHSVIDVTQSRGFR